MRSLSRSVVNTPMPATSLSEPLSEALPHHSTSAAKSIEPAFVTWSQLDQGLVLGRWRVAVGGLGLEVNRAVAGNSIGRARLGVEAGKVQPVSGETSEAWTDGLAGRLL